MASLDFQNTTPSSGFSKKLGLALAPFTDSCAKEWKNSKLTAGTVLLLATLALTLLLRQKTDIAAYHVDWMILALSVLIQWILGAPLYLKIVLHWKTHGSKLNLALAGLAAWAYALYQWNEGQVTQYFVTSSFILYVVTLLQYFEAKFLLETGTILQNIKDLRPSHALKKMGQQFEEVPIEDLKKGDIVQVPAGEIIPLDGQILSGTTSVDESVITGEFKPLLKGKDDTVVGATINRDSTITLRLNKNLSDNVLEKILASLTGTFGEKLPVFQKIERFGKSMSFVGILIVMALAYFLLVIQNLPLPMVFATLLATLLSFSSLSLAPSVIILSNVFTGQIFNRGILIRKGGFLESISKLKTLFFDKTGTLTKGHYEYSQTFIELGTNQGQMLTTLFSLESQSNHPLAESMETHPWFYEITKHPVAEFQQHAGLGVCGTVQPKAGKPYFAAVGNLRFIKRMQMHISRDMKNKMDELETMGETVLLCGFNKKVSGLISFSDVLRPKVRETLQGILKLEIEPAILTGDSEEDIHHLTDSLGITKVYSRCTPEEKTNKIAKEVKNGLHTGFIGVAEDPETFKKADVSFTLDVGTDIDNPLADVLFMGSDFRDIAWLLEKAKLMIKRVYFKLTVACIFITAFALVSLTGNATPELVTTFILILNLFFLRSSLKAKEEQENSDMLLGNHLQPTD